VLQRCGYCGFHFVLATVAHSMLCVFWQVTGSSSCLFFCAENSIIRIGLFCVLVSFIKLKKKWTSAHYSEQT
jgi:hypothetical protein